LRGAAVEILGVTRPRFGCSFRPRWSKPSQANLLKPIRISTNRSEVACPTNHCGDRINFVKTLNELYSSLSARRRYEVWFVRLGLAGGGGAWWLRYLLMNPGRRGCAGDSRGLPVQVWATWFPRDGKPQSFIRGFPLEGLDLSLRRENPFHFRIDNNEIGENFCRGALQIDGQAISWDLRWHSSFRVTLSSKGWIGFSRTPHSDALFSGQITINGRCFEGNPLGTGVQGHNCGYRHRTFWTWTHAYFPSSDRQSGAGQASTLEALVYEMPFGLTFRKAVLRHEGEQHEFRNLREFGRDADEFRWNFRCANREGFRLEASIDGTGPSIHRLPYVKTDCSGRFEVSNNSLASAMLRLERPGRPVETMKSSSGAVLEMVGR